MPSAPPPSNIRAFVQWKDASVYAGEEIECVITFRNIARAWQEEYATEAQRSLATNGHGHLRAASRAPSTVASRRTSMAPSRPPPPSRAASSGIPARNAPGVRGHRPTLSLNVVSAPSRGGLHSAPLPSHAPPGTVKPAKGHGRSLSIMSLGSTSTSEAQSPAPHKRPARGHGRSASMQLTSRTSTAWHAPQGLGIAGARQPSPLYESSTPPAGAEEVLPIRPARRRPGTTSANNTPDMSRGDIVRKSPNPEPLNTGFHFPAQSVVGKGGSPPKPPRNSSAMHTSSQRPSSPRPSEAWSGALSNLNPVARVMSESSRTGSTPRSSGDFYSMSNHSDETLTSEAPHQLQQNERMLSKALPTHLPPRQRLASHGPLAEPETLMMGYAQTMGNFTLDGSLVNPAPFEEVKRKGVQGGGGVVGIERSKRTSGMFGAFSWGNIGESLGGLLGGDDVSSMAQMKATAGLRSVPLLSTPQNLLFVDLRLAPGESKSFSYRFPLPRGLPPSHRGRAIKVQYHLSLGIQRPGGQAINQVEIPFRVLGSYNARGETLGHDLMSPYVLLQDSARSKSVVPSSRLDSGLPPFPSNDKQKILTTPKQGLEDFLRYTERLLADTRSDTNAALLSPTSPPAHSPLSSQQSSSADPTPTPVKEIIDLAILRSNHATASPSQPQTSAASPNRFNIARAGHPIAVLTLLRPAYRLGETVTGTIDFTRPSPSPQGQRQAKTYHLTLSLESFECVDPSLALRSNTSINRVTRKTHSSASETTLFARRISFSHRIPGSATPSFETTGVSLGWRLRVEFTTAREKGAVELRADDEGEEEEEGDEAGVLEVLGRDERGTVFVAREVLRAETFEIEVPLRVYGFAVAGGGRSESVDWGDGQGLEV
ncbi:hypothetical protein LTR62_004484 [Meristemomyces frigidus]|uniref:Rgp1-domain-containing protein n=1 Tax=Meristemomyces frigidus TaxID=1508187 RepID=A0AAN7YG71_9PEZI|nr:hypothetical protein LTR62_004484 [Meristemomyces frigidus]